MTPSLVVRHPPGYEPERRYAYDILLREFLGLEVTLVSEDRSDVELTLAGDSSGTRVTVADVLFATPEADWLSTGVAAGRAARALPRGEHLGSPSGPVRHAETRRESTSSARPSSC